MASKEEIGHSRHRQELLSELSSIIKKFAHKKGWDVKKESNQLGSYEGLIYRDTIKEQTLQFFIEFFDKGWVRIDIASNGDKWDSLVIITSSKDDYSIIIPQKESSSKAAVMIESILWKM